MAKETQKLTKEQMEDFKKFQKRLRDDPEFREGMRRLMGGAGYEHAVKMKKFGEKLSGISEGIDDIFFLSSTPAGRQQLRMKKLQKEQLEALRNLSNNQYKDGEYEDEFLTEYDIEEPLTEEEQAELDAIQKKYEAEEELKAEEDADEGGDTEVQTFEEKERATKMTAQLIAGLIIIAFGIIVFIAVMGSIK